MNTEYLNEDEIKINVDVKPKPLPPPMSSAEWKEKYCLRSDLLEAWKSFEKQTLVVDVFVGATKKNPSGRVRWEFPPGAIVMVPRTHSAAFHKVDEDGFIVGGLAPLLVREGQTDTVHEAVVPAAEVRRERTHRPAPKF